MPQFRHLVTLPLLAASALLPMTAAHATVVISSSVSMEANAKAGSGLPLATVSNSASQGATLNPLSTSASATSAVPGTDVSVTTQGSVAATWASANQGQVVFRSVGWISQDVGAGGEAYLHTGAPDWSYSFTAESNGLFTLAYNISTDPSTTNDFGLNGFIFLDPAGTPHYLDVYDLGPFPLSGSLSTPVLAGNSYTVSLDNSANIFGGLGTETSLMDATFNWSISSVPEPGTLALFGLGALGLAARRRKTA